MRHGVWLYKISTIVDHTAQYDEFRCSVRSFKISTIIDTMNTKSSLQRTKKACAIFTIVDAELHVVAEGEFVKESNNSTIVERNQLS